MNTNKEAVVLKLENGAELTGSVRMLDGALELITLFGRFKIKAESARIFCNVVLNHLLQGSPNKIK